MKKDTPRTDAAKKTYISLRQGGDFEYIEPEDMAELERENTRLREIVQTIASGLDRALDPDKTQTCRWMLEIPLTDEEHAIVKRGLASD